MRATENTATLRGAAILAERTRADALPTMIYEMRMPAAESSYEQRYTHYVSLLSSRRAPAKLLYIGYIPPPAMPSRRISASTHARIPKLPPSHQQFIYNARALALSRVI